MEIQNIKAMAELMRHYGLGKLEAKDSEFYILLESENHTAKKKETTPSFEFETLETKEIVHVDVMDTAPQPKAASSFEEQKSPLVGTLYLAPSTDSPNYVEVGSAVKKGDVLCIVESLKVLNEIVSEYDGVIEEICGENESIVEYGQTLFKISKNC